MPVMLPLDWMGLWCYLGITRVPFLFSRSCTFYYAESFSLLGFQFSHEIQILASCLFFFSLFPPTPACSH
jgi:hypothetical protein